MCELSHKEKLLVRYVELHLKKRKNNKDGEAEMLLTRMVLSMSHKQVLEAGEAILDKTHEIENGCGALKLQNGTAKSEQPP